LTFQTQKLVPNPQLVYSLRFGPAVAVFLLLSALAHFALSTFGYKWYVAKLKSGMNPARFYEYALSSSLMIVLIGMLVGVSDLGALILMFGINAMMNLFGIMMELHNQTTKKTDWTAYIYGCLAGIVPWIVIFMYFYGSLGSSSAKTAGVCLCHRANHLRVLQHLCGQHGIAIQKGWSLEGLSLRGTHVYRPEPARQDRPGLADLGGHSPALIVQVGLPKKAPDGFVTAGAFCVRESQLLHGSRFGF